MLFDLRGRGRRRTIQAIYVTLAVLMGGGLVFFGIGGNTSGGLFDAFKGGSGSSSDTFSKQATQAEKTLKVNPNDAAAWSVLARARFQQAGQGDSYNQQTSTFTDKGKSRLQESATAWEHYLTLNPRNPDDSLASLMVQVYAPTALNQPAKGVKAAQVVTATRPSAQTFYTLAVFAYAAGDKRTGNLAAAKTLSLTPAARKTQTKLLLDQAKKPQTAQGATQAPVQSATGQ
ncbi:MAG TPA: hypothetical protein VGN78_14795 [Solirubrobacteraceae bacterium]|jgi:hypothetical protein|nr:hypothetical protein [Solirubrobacteraceae bacterium]